MLLTLNDAINLQTILTAVQGNKRVRWAVDGDTHNVVDGIARAITHEDYSFLGHNEDIRDGYVWISSTFEFFLPVRKVMEQVKEGTWVIDD